MRFMVILLLFSIKVFSEPHFGFVQFDNSENRTVFSIIGSFYQGAKSILDFLNDNDTAQIGDLTSIELFDGNILIGGVYRNTQGVFRVIMISGLQIDPEARLLQDHLTDELTLTLKSVIFIDEFGDNRNFFRKLFNTNEVEVDQKYLSVTATIKEIEDLKVIQTEHMVNRFLKNTNNRD